MLSSIWHDPAIDAHGKNQAPVSFYDKTIGRVTGWFDRGTERLADGYQSILRWALVHKKSTVLLALAIFVASVFMVRFLGTEFVPKADFSETSLKFETPVGTSLEATEAKTRQVEAILRDFPEVRYTVSTINTANAQGKNNVNLYIRLVDRKNRSRNADQMSAVLRERLKQVPGIAVTHAGLLDAIGGNKQVEFSLQGPDQKELERLAVLALAKVRDIPGLVDLDSSVKPNKPVIGVEVLRDAASDLGLGTAQLAGPLRTLVAGQTVGNWRAPDDQTYDVNVRLAPEARNSPQDLERLPFMVAPAADGSPRIVRLGQVAKVSETTGSNQINRRDMMREVAINANVFGRQKHGRVLWLRPVGPGHGGDLHLHDFGQPVQELPAASGADDIPATDLDWRGAGLDGFSIYLVDVLHHRRDHAHGPGDQKRHLAGGLCHPRPGRRAGAQRGLAAGSQGAAAPDFDDHFGHDFWHGAAGFCAERRCRAARPHGTGGHWRCHHLLTADAGGGASRVLLHGRSGPMVARQSRPCASSSGLGHKRPLKSTDI
jgi:hypothetical protein